jgi:hypothetical protein
VVGVDECVEARPRIVRASSIEALAHERGEAID